MRVVYARANDCALSGRFRRAVYLGDLVLVKSWANKFLRVANRRQHAGTS